MTDTLKHARRVPTDKYELPVTSSHEYGWYAKPLVGIVYVTDYAIYGSAVNIFCLIVLLTIQIGSPARRIKNLRQFFVG